MSPPETGVRSHGGSRSAQRSPVRIPDSGSQAKRVRRAAAGRRRDRDREIRDELEPVRPWRGIERDKRVVRQPGELKRLGQVRKSGIDRGNGRRAQQPQRPAAVAGAIGSGTDPELVGAGHERGSDAADLERVSQPIVRVSIRVTSPESLLATHTDPPFAARAVGRPTEPSPRSSRSAGRSSTPWRRRCWRPIPRPASEQAPPAHRLSELSSSRSRRPGPALRPRRRSDPPPRSIRHSPRAPWREDRASVSGLATRSRNRPRPATARSCSPPRAPRHRSRSQTAGHRPAAPSGSRPRCPGRCAEWCRRACWPPTALPAAARLPG